MDRDEGVGPSPSDAVGFAAEGYRIYSEAALEFAAACAQAFFDVIVDSDPFGWRGFPLDISQ